MVKSLAARPQILCPHCKTANLRIRSSQQDHLLLKRLWLQCINPDCGFTCGGNLEITHQLSPSAIPNLNVQLQTLDQINAARKAANDENKEAEENG